MLYMLATIEAIYQGAPSRAKYPSSSRVVRHRRKMLLIRPHRCFTYYEAMLLTIKSAVKSLLCQNFTLHPSPTP